MLHLPRAAPRLCRIVGVLLALLALLAVPSARASVTRTFVPIGSDYTQTTLQRFALPAVQHAADGEVYLLVLPITYATDAYAISEEERAENLDLADFRRGQVEDACNAVRRSDQTCRAVLAPILVRDDAYLQGNLDLFTSDLDGMYILGGDQTIAMLVVADTPTEQRMAAAYQAGAVLGGNSAGAAVESLNMIAGYIGDNGPDNGLQQGSVDLWLSQGQSDHTRGLIFGLPNTILDQHTYQRGRIGRLLSVTWQTSLLGIGADAATAVVIENESRLVDVAGNTSAIVIDTATYGATGRYTGPTNSLAVHRVATHLIPPGGYGYDISTRRPLVGGRPIAPPTIVRHPGVRLRVPSGAGTLLLGGDISGDKTGAVAQRFVARSGGASARLVVLAAGYADSVAAQEDAQAYAEAFLSLGAAQAQPFMLDSSADLVAIKNALRQATGIFLTAPDQSRVLPALQQARSLGPAIHTAWRNGATLMADNAAAVALGQYMTADPPPTDDSLEDDAIGDFLVDGVDVQDGLGFLRGIAIEPRLLPDRHWGRLYNLLYRHPSLIAIGIDVGTAIEVTPAGATVRGTSAALTLDGRSASFSVGSNGALSARYVLLDSYVDGDLIGQ